MDKQMIEEMAKVSGGCDYPHRPCEKCWCKEKNECSAYAYAKSFYEEGYRKIPENAVVLTREEWDKVGIRLVQARKETAEKLLDEIDYESNGQTKSITDLFRKKYGV